MTSFYAEQKKLRKRIDEIFLALEGKEAFHSRLLYQLGLEFDLGENQFIKGLENAMLFHNYTLEGDIIKRVKNNA